MSRGPTIILDEAGIRIPGGLLDLKAFRRWTRSDAFPEKGRIDWIDGEVEVDMSPENLNGHASPKMAIAGALWAIVDARDLGVAYTDSTRLCSVEANLSAEPDVIVVLYATLEAGRARLVPSAGGGEGQFVEIEGAADLVVECVSDSSEKKDKERLFERYFLAGVREYWLCDVRRGAPLLRVHRRGKGGFRQQRPDADGYARSEVLGLAVRLVALPPRLGTVKYRLETR